MGNKSIFDSDGIDKSFIYTHEIFKDLEESIKKNREYRNHFVFDVLDRFITEEDCRFVTTIEKETTLYRARIVNDLDSKKFENKNNIICGYNELNSREPPLGVPNEGRNNIFGMSYLYLSNDISTACSEVKPVPGDYISLATFKLKRNMKVIDFTKDVLFRENEKQLFENCPYIELINKEVDEKNLSLRILFLLIKMKYFQKVNEKNKDDYKITQILTDYIRKTGIDGIAYYSSCDKGKKNYTIFNSHKSYIKFIKSELICNYSYNNHFVTLEGNNEIYTSCSNSFEIDDEIIDLQKKELYERINKSNNNIGGRD